MSPSSCDSCTQTNCSAQDRRPDEDEQTFIQRQNRQRRLCRIKHKILVMSGKGGVGKSTVAVNLAVELSLQGKTVGLLDIDLHGPSIPTMLGLAGRTVTADGEEIFPVIVGSLRVMSVGFLLPADDNPVIWRGPMKAGVIDQFLTQVEWGELDCLVVDLPPGTGDEPLSICQLMDDVTGAVVVTTPQAVATIDVRKCVRFCQRLEVPLLGVIENMSGFICPHCGETTEILCRPGKAEEWDAMGAPFLGRIPMAPEISESGDSGKPFVYHYNKSPVAAQFSQTVAPLLERLNSAVP